MNTSVSWLLLCSMSMICAISQAQSPEFASMKLSSASPGKLSGSIIDLASGSPLAGATVRLLYESESTSAIPDPNPADAVTTSGPNGEYSFEGLREGQCRIYAELPGYVRRYHGSRMVGSSPGISLTLKPGSLLSGINISLLRQGVLMGRIRFEDGGPAAEVLVSAVMVGYKGEKPFYYSVQSAESDADGNYTLQNLPAGQYLIRVSEDGPRQVSSAASRTAQEPTKHVLEPTFYPAGSSPEAAAKLAVGPGQRMDGIDIRVKRSKSYEVCGTVDWRATQRTQDALLALVTAEMDARSVLRPHVAKVGSDDSFCFGGVLPGAYFLEPARGPADIRRINHFSGSLSLEVRDEHLSRVKFVALPPTSYRGKVVAEISSANSGAHAAPMAPSLRRSSVPADRTAAPPPMPPTSAAPNHTAASQAEAQPATAQTIPALETRSPASHAELAIAQHQGIRVRLVAPGRLMVEEPKALTGSDATFALANVPTGRFKVEVTNVTEGFYVKRVELDGSDITTTGINSVSGQGGTIAVILGNGSRQLAGSVVDEKGNAIYGARVSLWSEESNFDAFAPPIRMALADASGRFSFSGLPPGRYRAVAWPEEVDPTMLQNPLFCRTFEGDSARVTLVDAMQEPNPLRLKAVTAQSVRAVGW